MQNQQIPLTITVMTSDSLFTTITNSKTMTAVKRWDKNLSALEYWFTRVFLIRWISFIYLVAFLILANQAMGLFGADGLLPIANYLEKSVHLTLTEKFLNLPTFFWLNLSDGTMQMMIYLGLALSVVGIFGFANGIMMFVLWAIYLSFVNVGQIFYGYGWEILLLEAGFLTIFLCPFWSFNLYSDRSPPSKIVILLFRWLVFRVMFGAGLIKLRSSDPCWTNLECLFYHYETQPNPSPLSYYFHQMPEWFHRGGVLFNHFAELIVPWFVFGPRRMRQFAGIFIIIFQGILILSGNLAFLNWLTIAISISCFDDSVLRRFFLAFSRAKVDAMEGIESSSLLKLISSFVLLVLVAILSINPVTNLISSRQVMNTSFDPFHLVNTYGAFGTVGKERLEIVLEGTADDKITKDTVWQAFEFHCKPTDIYRKPCLITPYHYRLDWQMWFAAMQTVEMNPWLVSLTDKLLNGDSSAAYLLKRNPFEKIPPTFIRAELFRYKFTDRNQNPSAWWERTYVSNYFPPVALKK